MAKVKEAVQALISSGQPQGTKMVEVAWRIVRKLNLKNVIMMESTQENRFVSRYREIVSTEIPTLVGSTYAEYLQFEKSISANSDEFNFSENIPDGPLISSSILHGKDLKQLLQLDDSISYRMLDWLALYTSSTGSSRTCRLHMTSLCTYNLDRKHNSFSFPVMADSVACSLSFPFIMNGEIQGICAVSPSTTKAYKNASHEVHLNAHQNFKYNLTLLLICVF